MEIKELKKAEYAGRKFTAKYKTNGYYDIYASGKGFEIEYKTFETTVEKSFDDEIFGEWLESPIAFGAFEKGELSGFVEGSMESWNNRFRISNICIFDDAKRGKGLGRSLMNAIETAAKNYDPRMIVLETQTCNEAAIKFYQKCGYSIIGFDMYAYTNDDPERKEVRIEMGKKLK